MIAEVNKEVQKVQGRDDSIKQFSMQLYPTSLSTSKICRVELCTELFYAIIPTSCYILMFFILVHVTFILAADVRLS